MRFLLLSLLISTSPYALAQNLKSVPFYFSVTEESHAPLNDTSWKKIPVKEVETDRAYLRGYSFLDPHTLWKDGEGTPRTSKSNRLTVEKKRALRKKIINDLYKKGILKHGDIALSFRPSWENTVPYSHLQMGVSHAAIVYEDENSIHNLDMPLNEEYNGKGFASNFDSDHYIETDHLQIVRPRDFDKTKQKNLSDWVKVVRKNAASIRAKGLMGFNSDYANSKFDKYGPADSFVTTMARVVSGTNTKATDLTMFCSEFVWAMLALSNCSTNDPELLNSSVKDAACVNPVFNAMSMIGTGDSLGLIEGPLAVIQSLDLSDQENNQLLGQLFKSKDIRSLSSGHRALATNPMVAMLMVLAQGGKVALDPTNPSHLVDFPGFYPAKLNGQGDHPMVIGVAQNTNAQGGRNYSPTSFLINAMLDSTHPERKLDYVATIIFADKL